MMRRLSAPTEKGRCLVSSPSSASSSSGGSRRDRRERSGRRLRQRRPQHGQLGLPGRRDGVRQRRHRAHEGPHHQLGPVAHEARQLGQPGDEVRDESHDRQIGRTERVTVNVDRHGRQRCGRRGLRNGRGEQWRRRRQRRRRRVALAAQRRQPQGPCPGDQEIAPRQKIAPPREPPALRPRPSRHRIMGYLEPSSHGTSL